MWFRGAAGGGRALAAAVLALAVLAPFALGAYVYARTPVGRTAATDGMIALDAVTASEGGDDAPEDDGASVLVEGRRFALPAAQVYANARLVLGDLGWQVLEVEAGDPDEPEGDLGTSGTVQVPLPTARDSLDPNAAADPLDQPESDEYLVFAVARDRILALPSDVTIRIVEDDEATFVDLRSTSRFGDFDLGQNRRFIESFLTGLDAAMTGAASVLPDG